MRKPTKQCTFLEYQAKFLKFGFSFEDMCLGYFQLAVWVIYIEHREIRDGSGSHTKASSVWKCTSLKPVAIKQYSVLFTEFGWLKAVFHRDCSNTHAIAVSQWLSPVAPRFRRFKMIVDTAGAGFRHRSILLSQQHAESDVCGGSPGTQRPESVRVQLGIFTYSDSIWQLP